MVAVQPAPSACATRLYQLTLTRGGHVASLDRLPVPQIEGVIEASGGLTASANGQAIAYAAYNCPSGTGNHGWLGVLSLRSGTIRAWTLPRTSEGFPASLSMSADGRQVLYTELWGPSSSMKTATSVQVLATYASPGPLFQRGRVVVAGGVLGSNGSTALLTPDGKTVLACAWPPSLQNGPHLVTLSALSAAAGKLLGVIHVWRSSGRLAAPYCLLSLASGGGYLMASGLSTTSSGTSVDLVTGATAQLANERASGQEYQPWGISW